MLKLLIVDDERIIRETIATLIDWKSLDIQLIGTAKDGIEAYNIILDEYPDIVLTDIKMPGFSGIELIKKIHDVNPQTQFIILSGYGEFEYAKTAMQYGVKHYLLKPCNEEQIVESIQSVKKDYADNIVLTPIKEQSESYSSIYHNIMVSLLNTCLSSACSDFPADTIVNIYSKYLDFKQTPYDLHYLYYIQPEYYQSILDQLIAYKTVHCPGLLINAIYVLNTLILYNPSLNTDNHIMEEFWKHLSIEQTVSPEYKNIKFSCLSDMLKELIPHIKRYDNILFISNIETNTCTMLNNYGNIIQESQTLISQIFTDDISKGQNSLSSLMDLLYSISSLDFLKQLTTSVIMTAFSKSKTFDMNDIANFLFYIERETVADEIRKQAKKCLEKCFDNYYSNKDAALLSSKVKQLITEHYKNPDLSLKWISENYLYMNVDYLSKRFLKETGSKFSKYLTDYRILKAKELMASFPSYSIQQIADLVGCGNNPQYFSQIFKKATGTTPSKYMKSIRSI